MKLNLIPNALTTHIRKSAHIYRQIFGTLAASMFCLAAGTVIGNTAILLPKLKDDKSFPHDEELDSWIASIATLAMAVICPFSGSLGDRFGTKKCQILLTFPYAIGWVTMGFATNNMMLLIGRFILGFASGTSRTYAFVYIAEIIDPKYRVVALFVLTLAYYVGFILCHIVGEYVYWKTSCFFFILPFILSVLLLLFLKESPQWLLVKGRIEEGRESFMLFRGNSDRSNKELTLMLEKCSDNTETSVRDLLSMLCSKCFVKSLFILFVMFVIVQWCGFNAFVFYAQDIFRVTFYGDVDPFLLMIGTDCIRLISCLIYCSLSNILSRKITFTVSCISCSLVLLGLIIYLYLHKTGLIWVGVILIALYIAITMPLLTITWTYVVELFPAQIRGFSSGLCSMITYGLLFSSTKIVPEILATYGDIAMYATFAVVAFVGGILLHFIIPDTTGRSLQDIENKWYEKKNIVTDCERDLSLNIISCSFSSKAIK